MSQHIDHMTVEELRQEVRRLRKVQQRLTRNIQEVREYCIANPKEEYGDDYPWDETDEITAEVKEVVLDLLQTTIIENPDNYTMITALDELQKILQEQEGTVEMLPTRGNTILTTQGPNGENLRYSHSFHIAARTVFDAMQQRNNPDATRDSQKFAEFREDFKKGCEIWVRRLKTEYVRDPSYGQVA